MLRIGLTGGIGSGKSTVARLFSVLDAPVYDSDSAAKRLMNNSPELKTAIRKLLGEEAYDSFGKLDRTYVASRVFSDKELLRILNSLVHPAVMSDFEQWAAIKEAKGCSYVIHESAILFESGFYSRMNYSVTVSAPVELRIKRVAGRDGRNEQDVRARMANQMDDSEREARADYIITNDETALLMPQVEELDKIFRNEDRR